MTNGVVLYDGLLIAKGAKYTQTKGVTPDRISVRMIPQVAPIAAHGDIQIGFGAEFLTIPNCLADRSLITMRGGFDGVVVFEDRRWVWLRAATVSFHRNERWPNGTINPASIRNLRLIVEDLLLAMGETSYDITEVSNTEFPEIDAVNRQPHELLQWILSKYGYEICLGFGNDPVTVLQRGSSLAALPSTNLMSFSEAIDPPTPPEIIRVIFNTSLAQARFKLAAVGLDTDGYIKPIDSLSYKSSRGWEHEPLEMTVVASEFGVDEQKLALQTVWRMYAITGFTDNTLDYPDGSGTLTEIEQVTPLLNELLKTVQRTDMTTRKQPQVYGSYMIKKIPLNYAADIDAPVDVRFVIDHNRGIVIFDRPLYLTDRDDPSTGLAPADLYLEAAFRIKDYAKNQWVSYTVDIPFDVNGIGVKTIFLPSDYATTIIEYGSNQTVASVTTNQAYLDALAADTALAAAGEYTYNYAEMRWYNRPMFDIRLDGQISQVQHIISDGTDGEPGHYTIAARNLEFDRFVQTSLAKRQDLVTTYVIRRTEEDSVLSPRKEKGNV